MPVSHVAVDHGASFGGMPTRASSDQPGRPRRDLLLCLLESLDPCEAAAFIRGHLASLQAYDRDHGTNLQEVLELALDHHSRNAAARAAFMHRNTFRRRLRKALELIDLDLDCPEHRLALHLALKMRGLVATRNRRSPLAAGSPNGGPPTV